MEYVKKRWNSLLRNIGRSLVERFPDFPYEPLANAGRDIRLLYLHPPLSLAGVDGVPSLSMMNINLDDEGCPPYCALSYTWGNPFKTSDPAIYDETEVRIVLINGRWFRVTLNLFLALHHISRNISRKYEESIFLWVDAICINQNDNVEKSAQVQRMGDIYSKSTGTIVWLGPSDEYTEGAFRKINAISDDFEEQIAVAEVRGEVHSLSLPVPHSLILGRRLRANEIGKARVLTIDELDKVPGIPEIKRLMSRTWWERSWIWQEVVCSRISLVVCGEYEVDFDVFYRLVTSVVIDIKTSSRFGDPIDSVFLRRLELLVSPISDMYKMRERLASPTQPSRRTPINLAIALYHIRHTSATDPRDKVYAGLGMCDSGHGIVIDYNLTTPSVYVDLVQQYILANSDLSIFNYCQFPPTLHELPSWTPDWTDRKSRRYSLDRLNGALDREIGLFRAGGPLSMQPQIRIDRMTGSASLTGKVFSTVAFVAHDEATSVEEQRHPDPDTTEILHDLRHGILGLVRFVWLRQWATLRPRGGVHSAPVRYFRSKKIKRGTRIRRTVFRWDSQWRFKPHADALQFEALVYKFTGEDVLLAYLRTLYADAIASSALGCKKRMRDWDVMPDDANMDSISIGRTFAATEADAFALVPGETRLGDVIAIFRGGELPYVLRPSAGGYLMIGECYLHGFMDGEAFRSIERRNGWETITLV